MQIFFSLIILFFTAFFAIPTVGAELPICTETDCNCSDFSTQAESQIILEAFSGDPFRLDRDRNGKACESLPAGDSTLTEEVPKTFATSNINLGFGNPSQANHNDFNNYLILEKPQYALSYNCQAGIANWVSWQLNSNWLGDIERSNDFRPDRDLPSGCYAVRPSDYRRSGYDKGHLAPSGDRTATESDNSATFLMTNMIAQSPSNNREVWRELEGYSRNLVDQGKELSIVAGGEGIEKTIAKGKVVVPKYTWKAILVLDQSGNPEETIAVIIPNTEEVAGTDWTDYIVSVDELEEITDYDFFSSLDKDLQAEIEEKAYLWFTSLQKS